MPLVKGTPEYLRAAKLRMVARSGTKPCACGCGIEIPCKAYSGGPRKYAAGHGAIRRKPGDTKKDAAGYVLEYAPEHPRTEDGWVRQHRLVWERAYGLLPPRVAVHHRNHDRADNRLENLEPIGPSAHMILHWRERWEGHIPCMEASHLKAPGNPVLTAEQVVQIRRRILRGETQMALARAFGVSGSAISRIWTGKSWACPTCDRGVVVSRLELEKRTRRKQTQGLTRPVALREARAELGLS